MGQRQYEKIPDLIELRKQLSEANKLRHKYWTQLRVVRNQISRYLRAHEIPREDFKELIKEFPKTKREYLQDEWTAGTKISLNELKEMFNIINVLWTTSQFKEELRRKRGKAPFFQAIQDPFFCDPICQNCQLPLTGRRKKFCSDICEAQYRKRKHKAKSKKNRVEKRMEDLGMESMDGPNPQPGVGKKASDLTCQHFADCLNKAINFNWQNFHCGRCNLKESS